MTGEEMLRLYVTLAVWGLMSLGAIKVLGIRRVVWALVMFVVFALAITFRTLGAFTGRRY